MATNNNTTTESWPESFVQETVKPTKKSVTENNKSSSKFFVQQIDNKNLETEKPLIIMVSKFNKLVKDSKKNEDIKNNDFNSGKIFKSLTPDGQYFDLQIQSRFLDYLGIQSIYNKLGQPTKKLLSDRKIENNKTISDLKNSAEALKNIFIYTDKASEEIFNYQELIKNLIDLKLLPSLTTANEWNSFKTWHEYIAVMMNSISGYTNLLTKDANTVVLNGPAIVYSNKHVKTFTKEKNFLMESKFSGIPDTILSLLRYNDPNFQLINLNGKVTNNSIYNNNLNIKYWFNKKIPSFQPYKLFSLLTQEILFSINNVYLESTDFQNLLGYNKYGQFDISEVPTYYTQTTLASLPWITIGENALDSRFLAGTLERKQADFGNTKVKSGHEHFILDSIYSINNEGIIQTDNISRLKGKFQNTIIKLEEIRNYLYSFNDLDEQGVLYLTDPINRIIKDLTTEESTSQKLVFTDSQSINAETLGNELIEGGFSDSKTYIPGEPWVIGLIKLCYYYQNNGVTSTYTGAKLGVPTMWHLLDALLSNSPNKIENLIKKVIYLYGEGPNNAMLYEDPLGPDRTGEGRGSFGERQLREATEGYEGNNVIVTKTNKYRKIAIAQRETLIKSFEQSETWSALSNIIKTYQKLLKLATKENNNKTKLNSVHDLYILYQILVFAVQIINKMPWKLSTSKELIEASAAIYDGNNTLGIRDYTIILFRPTKVPVNDGSINIQQFDSLLKAETTDIVSLSSGSFPEDLEKKLTFPNPQKMLDKLLLFLYKKKSLIEKLEFDIINSGNLAKLANLFYLDNNTKLNDVFNFSSTQIYSLLTRINDLDANFSKINSPINLLNNQIITNKTVKTAIYNKVKALPYGDIVTIGIPSGLLKSKVDTKSKIIKVTLSRVNELEKKRYKNIVYYFDLNVFPVWDFDRFDNTNGPILRSFRNDFSTIEFSNSTYQYSQELTKEIKDQINYNHKLSTIFDLYLSTFTGIQVNENSVFSKLMTNQITSVNGLMTTKDIKRAIDLDPISDTNSPIIKNQIELFLNTFNTYSDSKMIKLFTTHPTQYDRVFNVFVPYSGTSNDAIWEYQVKIEDDNIVTETTQSNASLDALNKPLQEITLDFILGNLNPEQVIRQPDSEYYYGASEYSNNTENVTMLAGGNINSYNTQNLVTGRTQ